MTLTANHVIEKSRTIRIMAGDRLLDAKVLAADAGLDIAILKIEGQGYLRCER
jgi:S1-C subfamily serine protease